MLNTNTSENSEITEERETNSISGNFRSMLNINTSENSENTVETSRAINSEISSQMSRKLEEMKSDPNSHILNAIDSAIEEKVIPSIRNALESQNSTENTNSDLRSDGPHPSTFGQVRPQRDLRSVGPQQQIAGKASQDAKKDFPKLVTMSSNQINHQRENSVDSYRSDDDEEGYDTTVSTFAKKHEKQSDRMFSPYFTLPKHAAVLSRHCTSCNCFGFSFFSSKYV